MQCSVDMSCCNLFFLQTIDGFYLSTSILHYRLIRINHHWQLLERDNHYCIDLSILFPIFPLELFLAVFFVLLSNVYTSLVFSKVKRNLAAEKLLFESPGN